MTARVESGLIRFTDRSPAALWAMCGAIALRIGRLDLSLEDYQALRSSGLADNRNALTPRGVEFAGLTDIAILNLTRVWMGKPPVLVPERVSLITPEVCAAPAATAPSVTAKIEIPWAKIVREECGRAGVSIARLAEKQRGDIDALKVRARIAHRMRAELRMSAARIGKRLRRNEQTITYLLAAYDPEGNKRG